MIDVEKYIKRMKDCIELSKDETETAHVMADDVLCDLICELGHLYIVELFNEVKKWYS